MKPTSIIRLNSIVCFALLCSAGNVQATEIQGSIKRFSNYSIALHYYGTLTQPQILDLEKRYPVVANARQTVNDPDGKLIYRIGSTNFHARWIGYASALRAAVATDQLIADKAVTDKAAAEKAAADKIVADKAAVAAREKTDWDDATALAAKTSNAFLKSLPADAVAPTKAAQQVGNGFPTIYVLPKADLPASSTRLIFDAEKHPELKITFFVNLDYIPGWTNNDNLHLANSAELKPYHFRFAARTWNPIPAIPKKGKWYITIVTSYQRGVNASNGTSLIEFSWAEQAPGQIANIKLDSRVTGFSFGDPGMSINTEDIKVQYR